MRVLALVLCVLALPLGQATVTVEVVTPPSLVAQFPNDLIPNHEGIFGIPPYGETVVGKLVYINATATDDGCDEFDSSSVTGWPTGDQGDLSVIALIDRGDCHFVKKVLHAENAGADAVIIANNVGGGIPYMADDGSGGNIHIPSVIIGKTDAGKLKDAVAAPDAEVILQMSFILPTSDTVHYELWTLAYLPGDQDFKRDFAPVAESLKANGGATFEPKYWILDGRHWRCTQPNLPCREQCTNQGRYCAVDPERNRNEGLDGADMVQENLRQMCVYKLLNESGKPELWWDYVTLFADTCAGSKATWTESCSFGLDGTPVSKADALACVTSSGGYDPQGGENTMLAAAMKEADLKGVHFVPTLSINGDPYRGDLRCAPPYEASECGPLGAICAAFTDGKEPDTCRPDEGCKIGVLRDECGVCGGDGKVDGCGLCLSPENELFNKSCLGCDGVINSGVERDECGVCGGDGAVDQCGICMSRSHALWGKLCLGCDGKPDSGATRDKCGVCGGTFYGDNTAVCYGQPNAAAAGIGGCSCSGGISAGGAVGIAILFSLLFAGIVGAIAQKQIMDLKKQIAFGGVSDDFRAQPLVVATDSEEPKPARARGSESGYARMEQTELPEY